MRGVHGLPSIPPDVNVRGYDIIIEAAIMVYSYVL